MIINQTICCEIGSNSPNLILDQFWLILLAPVINTLRNKVRDGSEPTKIGYKIPQNGQKLLKFSK